MSLKDEILIFERGDFSIIGIYRPFKKLSGETAQSNFTRLLQCIQNYIDENKKKKIVIMGDFNVDYLKMGDRTYQHHQLSSSLSDFQTYNNLEQLVTEITRHRLVNKRGQQHLQTSLLDHIYSNGLHTENVEIIPTISSDHDIIKCPILAKSKCSITTNKTIRDWRPYTKEKLQEQLSKTDWREIGETNDVTTLNDRIEQTLKQAYDKVVPWKTIKLRGNNQLEDLNIQSLKRRRDNSYKKWKLTKNTFNYNELSELNKKLKNSVFQARKKLLEKQFNTRDPKQFWKAVNSELGKTSNPKIEIQLNGIINKDPNQLANIFASTFQEKIANNQSKLGKKRLHDHSKKIIGLENYKNDSINFDQELVKKIIMDLPTKKCCGHDDIPSVIYKDSVELILPSMTKLLNLIANTSSIPSNWRIAKITPIFKKGSKLDKNNYRPISNICTISKIYEKLILDYINKLELRSNTTLSGDHQHGFGKNKSTTTAGLTIQSRAAKILAKNKYAIMYSTDLTAAFDMLDSTLFRQRIFNMGLPTQLCNILHDFLIDRQAYVQIDSATSDLFDINLGCVQGSVLGPVIFNIFMRPLADEVDNITSYADDTYGIVEIDNIDNIDNKAMVSTKILDHLKWLRQTGMLVNDSKTEIMVMHKTEQKTVDFTINNEIIKSKNNMNILGVHFTQNLKWQKHVEININSCQRILHGLKIIRKYFTTERFTQVLTTFLFSKFFYAYEIWSYELLDFESKRKIDSFYYKACRVIINDFDMKISRNTIDTLIKRANPKEFSKYCCARTIINAFNMKTFSSIKNICTNNYSIVRKPGRLFFFDNSKNKVEKNSIENRVDLTFKALDFPWLDEPFNKICPRLKKCLFQYAA